MSKKSKAELIDTNDFEGAKDRFDNANARWKGHWFDCCQQIFNSCKDWAKKYIIDPIERTIHAIGEMIKKVKPKSNGTSHTYLIKMYDDCGKWVYTKIGKANVLKDRLNRLRREHYNKENVQIADVEIIKTYELPNDDLAQVLESFMRNYFRKNKSERYIPNDRFDAFEPTEEDFAVFENYYQLTVANA